MNMAKEALTYRIILKEEPEGGFTATVPALPGCITYGENLDEALTMAREAIEGYIEILKEKGEAIPDDSKSFEYAMSISA
jgi:antitoxin HicB